MQRYSQDMRSATIKNYEIKKIEEEERLNKTSDNIYYNVVVVNNSQTQFIPVEYADNRIIQILKKPDDYYAAVIRFKVPLSSIPIIVFRNNYYYVRLAFGGVNYEAPVVFTAPIPPSGNQYVFYIQQFLDFINDVLTTLYAAVVAANPANPAVPAGFAPRILFNTETQLFTLRCRDVFVNTNTNANPPPPTNPPNPAVLNIFFSNTLNTLFFFRSDGEVPPIAFPNSTELQFVKDNGNNSITIAGSLYYDMPQETTTVYLFNELQDVIFISNSLGTKSESIPGIGTNIGQDTTGTDNQISIIADFEPIQQFHIDRGYLQFVQTGPYRYIDFDTNAEIRNLKINAYWVDKQLQLHQIFLAPGQSFTMKLMFKKKNVANSGK